jgi:hypothetical protein
MTDKLKSPVVDLDGLTTYAPAIYAADAGDMNPVPGGDWVRLEDVRALLTPTSAAPHDKPYEVVLDSRDLWDTIRAAHREGQSCGHLDTVESWDVASTHANATVMSWKSLRRVPADYAGAVVRWAIGELLAALPDNIDWLNPDVERVLRAAVGVPIGRANK